MTKFKQLQEMERFVETLPNEFDAEVVKVTEYGIYFNSRDLPCDPIQLFYMFVNPNDGKIQVCEVEGFRRAWDSFEDLKEHNDKKLN